jgi:hypothetical protein
MRRHHQAVQLLVRRIGQGKDPPIAGGGFVRGFHLDAPNDAVLAWYGGNLEAVALTARNFNGLGKVKRIDVARDLDRFRRARGCRHQHDGRQRGHPEKRHLCKSAGQIGPSVLAVIGSPAISA